MGYLNLKRYLISSPMINIMQDPVNESWLVQEVWNRMWRFSPLAQHCGLFISKDIATPPHRTAYISMTKRYPCVCAMCSLCWPISRVIKRGGVAPGITGELSKLCCREDRISLFTPLNGALNSTGSLAMWLTLPNDLSYLLGKPAGNNIHGGAL